MSWIFRKSLTVCFGSPRATVARNPEATIEGGVGTGQGTDGYAVKFGPQKLDTLTKCGLPESVYRGSSSMNTGNSVSSSFNFPFETTALSTFGCVCPISVITCVM